MSVMLKLSHLVQTLMNKLPESLLLLLARFALAGVFWLSAQTKIDGVALNPFAGLFHLGWPEMKETTLFLFEYEYALPLLPPVFAAYLATIAEHVFAILLLIGLATRLAALGVVTMTLVIQVFVYPDAYATHATWIALGLWIAKKGAGVISLDALVARQPKQPEH